MNLTTDDLKLLASLGVSARLQDFPLIVIALARHIAELQARVEQLEGRKR